MRKTSGRGLVGVIVAVLIVVVATVFFATGSSLTGEKPAERADGKGETVVGKSILAGKDSKCRSNLSQVRQGIMVATDPVDDTRPATLEQTRLGSQFYVCPIGKENYLYDPQTGIVSCPHPGHEKY